jgi:hypothetical protein
MTAFDGYPYVIYGSTFLIISIVALLTLTKAALWSCLNFNNLKVYLTCGFKVLILLYLFQIIPSNSHHQNQFSFSWNIESTLSLCLTNVINQGFIGCLIFCFISLSIFFPLSSSCLIRSQSLCFSFGNSCS